VLDSRPSSPPPDSAPRGLPPAAYASAAPPKTSTPSGVTKRVKGPLVLALVLIGTLLGAVCALALWWVNRQRAPVAQPVPAPSPATAEPIAAAPPVAPAPPVVAPTIASAAAAASAPAPASAAPAPAAAVPDDGADGSELLHNQGYLIVTSSVDADVYATGFKIGRTNQKNKSRCYLRYVRLGQGDPPKWISPGITASVKCQGVTTVALEPGDPGPIER
jgi:hypothetical protein